MTCLPLCSRGGCERLPATPAVYCPEHLAEAVARVEREVEARQPCTHEDLDRLGDDEVVCYGCMQVAYIVDLLDTERPLVDPANWRPL